MTQYIKKKTQPLNTDFTILYDNREVGKGKKPWLFLAKTYGAMKKVHLKTGDYTIEGLESVISLERKSGIDELLRDLTGIYRPTFERFLERMSKFPIKAIVVETEFRQTTVESLLRAISYKSNGKSRLTPDTIPHWTSEIMMNYGVPILFVDRRTAYRILPFIFESAYKRAKEIRK